MSEYMTFFIRRDSDNFVPLFTFSRSCKIYQRFQHEVPYEKVSALSYSVLSDALNGLHDFIIQCKDNIRKLEYEKTFVASFNNSVEEKMEALSDIKELIAENEEDIRDTERAYYSVLALIDIVDEIAYNPAYDKDRYIYAGIEVCDPTDKDVEEK